MNHYNAAPNNSQNGAQAEEIALKYLQNQGMVFVAQNFHSRFGEIDLIMQHEQHLVFVEVRYRKGQNFGGALESITRHKQHKLRRTAELYLIKNHPQIPPCRFDVVCLQGSLTKPSILWLDNAF